MSVGTGLDILLIIITLPVLLAATTLAVQIVNSLFPAQTAPSPSYPRIAAAVIVPAHNESATLRHYLPVLFDQLRPGDRLIVVADNCTDDTADVARSLGADVVQRNDTTRIGKAYALEAGVKHMMRWEPRAVAVFVDADCVLGPGALDMLIAACCDEDAPVQARYAMDIPRNADVRQRIAAFAWRVKNEVRPLGFHALGLPCLLMGTGMAFPSHLLRRIDLATGHIAEDLVIGLQSALLDYAPVYCPQAVVTSTFAPSANGRDTQKARWVHGHLSAIGEFAPQILAEGLRRHKMNLCAVAADLMVPPLGLLGVAIVALDVVTFAWWAAGGWAVPAIMAGVSTLLSFGALAIAWVSAGRDLIAPGEFASLASYTARQFLIGGRFFSGRRSGWVRSER